MRARVEHAGRRAVEARLVDERDGTVLAEDRGDRGRLVLEADVEVTPGERTFTVEVEEPPGVGDVSTTYALPEADASRPDGDGASTSDEDEGMTGFDYVVASGWALLCAVFLLSVAAGTGGFVQGIVTGTFLAAFGAYLALAPSHRWGLWTLIGVGVGALATVVLLPFTPLVQMDGFLMAAGIAAAGLGAAGVVGLLHGGD